jgi:hypothetical protein
MSSVISEAPFGVQLWVWAILSVILVAWLVRQFYEGLPPKLNFPTVEVKDGDFAVAILEGHRKVSPRPAILKIASSEKVP